MRRPGQPAVSDPWAALVPSRETPWSLRRVAHLHRAAGFAATWDELQRDMKDGPQASVGRLLAGQARREGVPDDFASVAGKLAAFAVSSGDLGRLRAWWLYRMLFGPDPLTENLTLFWHNHFATSAEKVGTAVYRQNEIFRELARAPFGELLNRVVRDPALLLWLDAQENRKGNPNENLARELMELFTLGIGHYTETDVKEAARALTGWTVAEGRFKDDADGHDGGEKSILGRKGRWKGADLVKTLLQHPATAQRLAARLCEQFFGEGAIDQPAVRSLADGLRARELDIGWAVEIVLRSQAFFADANLGTRILGPVEFVVGAARALALFDPAPSTLVLAEYAANLGQDLFHPPNVGGWPGGRSWVSTRSMIGRFNFAAALVGGESVGRGEPLDALGLARRHDRGGDPEAVVGFFADLVLGYQPGPAWRDNLLAALGPNPQAEANTVRRAVTIILASPEAQLV